MSLLNQSNFPYLWLLMQKTIGGTPSKQQFAKKWYKGQSKILEIGCSVGNISSCFTNLKDIKYFGIDIDLNVINVAKKRFINNSNFSFQHINLADFIKTGIRFDYILFAAILHHVDDETSIQMLRDVKKCASEGSSIIIYDPEKTTSDDSFLLRLFLKLFEQGRYLRYKSQYQDLIEKSGLKIIESLSEMQSPGIVKRPYVARFSLFHCKIL